MEGLILLIVTFIIIAVILIAIILVVARKYREKTIKKEISRLDKEKNLIASTPIMSELVKIEPIIKNDKMGEKYKLWQRRFEVIREEKINGINDLIIDLERSFSKKEYKEINLKLAKTELEVYKVRENAEELLDQIKEITLSEEKYRSIITKLKAKYREMNKYFTTNKKDYEEIAEVIELQFENIEKRFLDFEETMEGNEYSEVIHVLKALDTMIDHMSVVIDETPDLVLLSSKLIPRRIEEVKNEYQKMLDDNYNVEYLKIEYNLEEATKNVNTIFDRIKVLNLEDCMLELKTMLDYIDMVFNDFEKERLCRKTYYDLMDPFAKNLKKTTKIVKDIYIQIDDIKNLYDLKERDIITLREIGDRLAELQETYKTHKKTLEDASVPYSVLLKEVEKFKVMLVKIDEDIENSLKSLGSMKDDESRAREQLEEIELLLRQCKFKIRSFKLPIIMNNYFIELNEANDAIAEIVRELNNKPIIIKTLNTRVDTARDLVLKLYNTTNEMVKSARLAEIAIVYGNKYRSDSEDIDISLDKAEMLFHKGNYRESLALTIDAIETMEPGILERVSTYYER